MLLCGVSAKAHDDTSAAATAAAILQLDRTGDPPLAFPATLKVAIVFLVRQGAESAWVPCAKSLAPAATAWCRDFIARGINRSSRTIRIMRSPCHAPQTDYIGSQ